jgi:hypothetical protein
MGVSPSNPRRVGEKEEYEVSGTGWEEDARGNRALDIVAGFQEKEVLHYLPSL